MPKKIRLLASSLKMTKSTLFRRIKESDIQVFNYAYKNIFLYSKTS